MLKDVLGHSLDEIATLLDLTPPAVKAALHRGRARLARIETPARAQGRARHRRLVARYAALFNARDWDGVRALLAEDVRLDLVSRVQRAGKRNVGNYFSNYDRLADWHLVPAWLDGREVIAVLSRRAGRAAELLHRARGGERRHRRDPRFPLCAVHRSRGQVRTKPGVTSSCRRRIW